MHQLLLTILLVVPTLGSPAWCEPTLELGTLLRLDGPRGVACDFEGAVPRELRIYFRESETDPWVLVFSCARVRDEKRNFAGEYLLTGWHASSSGGFDQSSPLLSSRSTGEFKFGGGGAGYSLLWLHGALP